MADATGCQSKLSSIGVPLLVPGVDGLKGIGADPETLRPDDLMRRISTFPGSFTFVIASAVCPTFTPTRGGVLIPHQKGI